VTEDITCIHRLGYCTYIQVQYLIDNHQVIFHQNRLYESSSSCNHHRAAKIFYSCAI